MSDELVSDELHEESSDELDDESSKRQALSDEAQDESSDEPDDASSNRQALSDEVQSDATGDESTNPQTLLANDASSDELVATSANSCEMSFVTVVSSSSTE
ncbi:MAG: hypothetical protein QM831_04260 [Kofleriaceae bacterium]